MLPWQFMSERRVLYRFDQWWKCDLQERGIAVQSWHHHHLFGQHLRDVWWTWKSVLRQQPLYGAQYLLPNHAGARYVRGVWRSQPTLLSQSNRGWIRHVFTRLCLPEWNGWPSKLHGLRRAQPALLFGVRLHDRFVPVRHLQLATRAIPSAILCS